MRSLIDESRRRTGGSRDDVRKMKGRGGVSVERVCAERDDV